MKRNVTDMRQHIIDVARAIITHKGYSAVGISEIVKAADIPKGSFYYYFPSKEAFAEALLEHYFSHYLLEVEHQLGGTGTARERLLRYFTFWKTTQGADLPESKCLVVKLGRKSATSTITCGMCWQRAPMKLCSKLLPASGSVRKMAPARRNGCH